MFGNIDLSIIFLFGIEAVLALILTLIAIRYVRSSIFRTLLVVLFTLFLPLGYTAFTELMGRPKPISLIWVKSNLISDIKELNAEILTFQLVEGVGIYLYMLVPESSEPLSVVLPWSRKTAQALQDAGREAEANKNGLTMKMPLETSYDEGEVMFYAPPQPAMPLKDPMTPAQEYRRN